MPLPPISTWSARAATATRSPCWARTGTPLAPPGRCAPSCPAPAVVVLAAASDNGWARCSRCMPTACGPGRRRCRPHRHRRHGQLPAAVSPGPTARCRWPTTPTASARCWASWTPGCWPKARTCGRSRCWAPRRVSMAAWPAPALPCGHPMPCASAWSAISTSGTAAATRCACAASAACGSCSCPAWRRRPLQVRTARPARPAAAAEGRPDGTRRRAAPATASVVAPLPRWCRPARPSARRPTRWARRSASTRCTPARGGASPKRATAG
jgi:hypothetical protein